MSNKTFDFLVFIGRFQPFHNGHKHIIDHALAQAEHVIILVGSSHEPRSLTNPWTFSEREQFLRSAFTGEEQQHLMVLPLMDDVYNDQNWTRLVQQSIHGVTCRYPPKVGQTSPRIGLIGHTKDASSFYLALFPQWEYVELAAYKNVSATPLREQYFCQGIIGDEFPTAVKAELASFQHSVTYQHIAAEWAFIESYKKGWDNTPYPPTFVTVDAIVVHSGHILLVERKARPGKGQWALPGGFVNQHERLHDAVLRELREETRIKVPKPVLAGSVVRSQVFDDPKRSERGRTITHAYLIELKPDGQLPKVKGGDDARSAFWLPLSELNPASMFEDHFHIIKNMLG